MFWGTHSRTLAGASRDSIFGKPLKGFCDRSVNSIRSWIAVLKEHLGQLPLSALEEPDDINRFKTDSDYAEDVELAALHRMLETLRAAINWGMAQTPPLFTKSPFLRFGVRLNKKAETSRDRRLSRDEERRLLDAALHLMNTAENQFVGVLLHDRIIGALELSCRRGEMLLIQNKRVNWETCQIGIPGATAKDKENRRITFNPSPVDAWAREHPADAALSQRDRRGATKRTGGELEKRKPTAPCCLTKLIGSLAPPSCPRFVPGLAKFGLRAPATNITTSAIIHSCSAPTALGSVLESTLARAVSRGRRSRPPDRRNGRSSAQPCSGRRS